MDFARFGRMETERLTLCQMAEVDAGDLAAKINNYDIARWLTRVPHPYRLEDAQSFITGRSETPAPTWASTVPGHAPHTAMPAPRTAAPATVPP